MKENLLLLKDFLEPQGMEFTNISLQYQKISVLINHMTQLINTNTYIYINKENDKENPKFEVGDHVRISKYKNIFVEGYLLNWSEKDFIIKKVGKYCAVDIYYQ